MKIKFLMTILLGVVVFAFSCKPSGSPKGAAETPTRVQVGSSGDAVAEKVWNGTENGFNPSSQVLVVNLDHDATPVVGSTALPICYKILPSNFEVGQAVCADTGKKTTLLAGQVKQKCIKDNLDIKATQALDVDSCSNLKIYSFTFNPELTFTVE